MTEVTIFTREKYDSPIVKDMKRAVKATLKDYRTPAKNIAIKKPPAAYRDRTLIDIKMATVEPDGFVNSVASDITERIGRDNIYVQIVYPKGKIFKDGKPFPAP
jgi:hypothetical protein